MLTPSMGYEAGKGRELELEKKLAQRRLLAEALAVQRQQRASLLDRIVGQLKALATLGRRPETPPRGREAGGLHQQRPAAA